MAENKEPEDLVSNQSSGFYRWLPFASLFAALLVQTVTITWHASQLSFNQAYMKNDLAELTTSVKEIREEQRTIAAKLYNVQRLEEEFEKIQVWIETNKYTFQDLIRRVDELEANVKSIIK
jgi:xanthine dehydrogenase molybdopterin-binding subunit B